MQAKQFYALAQGDKFMYSDDYGTSNWEVTGADGIDMIDARCTDPGYHDAPEEVFYDSQSRYMTFNPAPYTQEHSIRQRHIRDWQRMVRTGFPGRDLISKSIGRRFGTWRVQASLINTIRFLTPDGTVVSTTRTWGKY